MSAGQLNQLVIGKESTWGTPVVPAKAVRARFGGGIQTDNDMQMISPMRAILAKNTDVYIGARKHEGDFEFDLYPDNSMYFLISALGGVSSALKSAETVVYEHAVSEQESKMPLTVEQVVGENVRRFAGVIAQSFKLSAKTGEAVSMETSVLGKSQASASKVTPTYLTSRPYNWNDVTISLGGTEMSNIVEFELEYNNNLEYLHALNGESDPAFNVVKGSEVKGKIVFYLDSTSLDELNDALAKTNKAFELTLTGDSIGDASNNGLTISVPKIFYTTQETELSEDYNALTLEFEGVYDPTTSKLISATITNLLSDYS